jgi:flagellar basal body-associated protein FliL
MEENNNQTIKQETQKSDKGINTIIIVLLVLIIVVLGVLARYQFLKKGTVVTEPGNTSGQTPTQEETTTQEETDVVDQTTQNQGQGSGQSIGTGTAIKADIDGDLKTLDKLDLSGIENDYGEDQLSDL